MDKQTRIAELEQQVKRLQDEVARLRSGAAPEPSSEEGGLAHWVDDMRAGVGRALSGDSGLETRVGGVWLGRAAVLLMMTTIALGAVTGAQQGALAPGYRALIGYALCVAAIVYGLLGRNREDRFAMTLLGAGLAGTYYVTYALFFVEAMALWKSPWAATLTLTACLALLTGILHWRKSQTAAGIALFLVYYTVMAGCATSGRQEDLVYALAACAILSLATFWFHAAHRWMGVTWGALLATYATYLLFFHTKPAALLIEPRPYFWITSALLSLYFVMFSLAAVVDARRRGAYRRSPALLSLANTIIYATLMWEPVNATFENYVWAFRLGLTVFLGLMGILAETAGPDRNRLYQVLLAQCFVFLALTLESVLSGEELMTSLAAVCLVLALAYARRGVVLFKAVNVALLAGVTAYALFAPRTAVMLAWGPYTAPKAWVYYGSVVAALALTAAAYERIVRRPRPEQRRRSGHWFLADTLIDLPGTAMSMLHAAAAAFILMGLTLSDRGDDPALPYILGAQAAVLVIAGLLLRTPQLCAASMVLLVAAHGAYHFLLFIALPGFEDQASYVLYTALLALMTFVGAHFWEQFLERMPGPRTWDHHSAVAIPYLLGTALCAALIARALNWIYAPLAYNILGAALVLGGLVFMRTGVKASGVLLQAIGTAYFYLQIRVYRDALSDPSDFPLYVVLLLVTYLCAERLIHLMRGQGGHPAYFEDALRTILAAAMAAVGVAALGVWAPPAYLTLCLVAHGFATLFLGAVFREARYRWAALCVFAIAVVRAYRFDLTKLPPLLQIASFAGLTLGLLAVSWAYSRRRLRLTGRNGNTSRRG